MVAGVPCEVDVGEALQVVAGRPVRQAIEGEVEHHRAGAAAKSPRSCARIPPDGRAPRAGARRRAWEGRWRRSPGPPRSRRPSARRTADALPVRRLDRGDLPPPCGARRRVPSGDRPWPRSWSRAPPLPITMPKAWFRHRPRDRETARRPEDVRTRSRDACPGGERRLQLRVRETPVEEVARRGGRTRRAVSASPARALLAPGLPEHARHLARRHRRAEEAEDVRWPSPGSRSSIARQAYRVRRRSAAMRRQVRLEVGRDPEPGPVRGRRRRSSRSPGRAREGRGGVEALPRTSRRKRAGEQAQVHGGVESGACQRPAAVRRRPRPSNPRRPATSDLPSRDETTFQAFCGETAMRPSGEAVVGRRLLRTSASDYVACLPSRRYSASPFDGE